MLHDLSSQFVRSRVIPNPQWIGPVGEQQSNGFFRIVAMTESAFLRVLAVAHHKWPN
jgi:hypothetical protein